jgi:hypothetical protein
MRKHIFAIVIVTLALAYSCFAQAVVITPKKATYIRPKPLVDFKKTFTVTRPVVKASTPALSRKIAAAISYEKVSNINVREEISEVQWLEEADFKVNYNNNGILDITLIVTGSGAYPSTYEKTVVINTKTGVRATPATVFSGLAGLAAKVKKLQEAEIKSAIAELRKNDPDIDDPESLFSSSDFTVENLDHFTISDKGVTFIYDYGFPHVIRALQPEGRYFIAWEDIKSHVNLAGLFGRFVR